MPMSMTMAPVSLPVCRPRPAKGTSPEASQITARKRASVHMIDDSASAKRMSLFFNNPRSRSFSESWVLLSHASPSSPSFPLSPLSTITTTALKPEIAQADAPSAIRNVSPSLHQDGRSSFGSSFSSSSSISASLSYVPHSGSSSSSTSASSPTPPLTTPTTTVTDTMTSSSKSEEMQDQELLRSLASFLRGEAYSQAAVEEGCKGGARVTSGTSGTMDVVQAPAQSAGPTDTPMEDLSDLVITVRDFAYPSSHPYHFGQYPPDPVYEESDIEEDLDLDQDYTLSSFPEQDSTVHTHNNPSSSSLFTSIINTATTTPTSSESIPAYHPENLEYPTQGHARALYDFDAESSTELSFREGNYLWVHRLQFNGWFLAEMEGVSGLVPENYVQLI